MASEMWKQLLIKTSNVNVHFNSIITLLLTLNQKRWKYQSVCILNKKEKLYKFSKIEVISLSLKSDKSITSWSKKTNQTKVIQPNIVQKVMRHIMQQLFLPRTHLSDTIDKDKQQQFGKKRWHPTLRRQNLRGIDAILYIDSLSAIQT